MGRSCCGGNAAGVDRAGWHLMTGLLYPMRVAGYGPTKCSASARAASPSTPKRTSRYRCRAISRPCRLPLSRSGGSAPCKRQCYRPRSCPGDRALERVASGETDPIEIADHDAPGGEWGRFGVRYVVRPAVLPHKLTRLAQVRSWHAREQVVFDLVVESAHQRRGPPTATDVA
jgi:hypothetical protein